MPTFASKTETFYIPTEKLIDVIEVLNERSSPDNVGAHITVSRPTIKASAPFATATDLLSQINIGGPINDSAALTIAQRYASGQGNGVTFNALIQGQPVAVDELLDAIEHERGFTGSPTKRDMLEALARWAEGADE